MIPVLMCWSGGKDSCGALHELQRSPDHEIVGLLATVTRDDDRISTHGVRRDLLEAQADALGLPLHVIFIPAGASNADYEAAMAEALGRRHANGIRTVACVDLTKLDASFAGHESDASLLADLPERIDPAGENGEFHSFAFDGPNFARPVAIRLGETVLRDGFGFRDLLPA